MRSRPPLPFRLSLLPTLAALAVRITSATGSYRGTGGASFPIITFGPVTLTAADGTTSTFKIEIPEEPA